MSTPTNIPETPMSEPELGSFFRSKEKFHLQLQHIFQTTLRLTDPDQFDQLCQWVEYRQCLTIDDLFDTFRNEPENFDNRGPATEYKWKGKMNHISPNVAQELKNFVRWMLHEEKPYELHDDFIANLTRESFLKFRHLDTQPLSTLPPPHHESQQHMTSSPSELKQSTQPESKIALSNFKKGTKRDASVYPIFKNDKYYDTFQRSFLANLKAQGLYDVADPDYDFESGDIYEQELFQGKQSFVYSVLVASLQTEKGRELVKEFEGDARSIILKLHHYHTKSNVAQHDIITLTTDITNLTLNDSWKGTVRQFLSHFKEKLRLLDSLVPVSDQLPETTRITFLQRAVQHNHDLRQIHVMDSVWRFKTESTDTLTFETYYNLLWDAAHQYDLHHTKKGPQRKAFISQHEEVNDEDGYIIEAEQSFNDSEPEEESSPYSVFQSSSHPKTPQKSYLPPKIWETLSESTKQMVIEHNKKVKLNNPTPYTGGSKAKPNPTLGKPNPAPQQVHQHSQDDVKEEPPPDTSAQTLVNKCLADSGIDPTDIQNVMSVSHAKRNISSHDSSRKIHIHQRYGVVKRYINTLMNLTGAPAHCWLLCMLYVCSLLNATASPALEGLTPLQALTGQVPDISHFLHFSFWEPIYYKVDENEPDHRFPSQSNEKRGHWVGFADNKGDHLTWKILTDDTNTIIIRSAVRSATKTSPNLRLDPPEGEDPSDLTSDVFVYGRPNPDGSDHTPPMSIINFDDLLGRTFLLPMDENGERKRATISEHVKDLYQDQVSREDQLRFKTKD